MPLPAPPPFSLYYLLLSSSRVPAASPTQTDQKLIRPNAPETFALQLLVHGNNQGLGIHSTDGLNTAATGIDLIDDKTTFEEVAAWGMSFDRLMKHKSGQKYFAEFLKSEYSDENILFWQACEELKRERTPRKLRKRLVLSTRISSLSLVPKKPSAHTFDEAQNQIFTLMQRDSYPRFIASNLYKKILSSYGHMVDL
uniref:RGS domain-containing protein n=1 Tax=Ditylenchus dipsaci TaxID=166011 RepID=A0A915EPE7_9BILA